MNLQNILDAIQDRDPEFGERISPRRSAIRTFLRSASLAAVPVALGGLFKQAYGKTTDVISDVLNFALKLELLEAGYYKQAIANAGTLGLAGPALTAITKIYNHEQAHVKFLTTTLTTLQATIAPAPVFDYSGGAGSGTGFFADALTTDYAKFLALAQVFEDTGVRAYKGQAANLKENNEVLTAALQIHAVETRHAAHIRKMRANNAGDASVKGSLKPWITGSESGIETGNSTVNGLISQAYADENTSIQSVINIERFVSYQAATEAFDEPLSAAQVTAIITPFIKP